MSGETSRYKSTTVVVEGQDAFYAIRTSPKWPPRFDDRSVTAQYGDDLTLLAYKLFGDAKLWWVLADFNDIIDPTLELTPGVVLRAPSNSRLLLEVLK